MPPTNINQRAIPNNRHDDSSSMQLCVQINSSKVRKVEQKEVLIHSSHFYLLHDAKRKTAIQPNFESPLGLVSDIDKNLIKSHNISNNKKNNKNYTPRQKINYPQHTHHDKECHAIRCN